MRNKTIHFGRFSVPRAIPILAIIVLALGAMMFVGLTQEGQSLAELRRLAYQKLGHKPSYLASRGGQRRVRKSRRLATGTRRRRRVKRAENVRLVRATPSKVKKSSALTVKVLDRTGKPVPNITMAAVIKGNSGPDITATKVTNANGNLVLEKVGPLPAAVELNSASPRWQLADVDSSSFIVKVSDDSMQYQTAKLRPAVMTLNVSGGAGSVLSSPALDKPIEIITGDPDGDDDDDDDENAEEDKAAAAVPDEDAKIENVAATQTVELPTENLEDGAVPVVLSKDAPGGTLETVILNYDEDADTENINAPAPRLVNVKNITIAGNIGILSTDDEVEKALGKMPKDDDKRKVNLVYDEKDGLTDGSAWWVYPKFGVAVKERASDIQNLHLTERIRLLTAQGGNISGIGVGSTVADLRAALGDPTVANAPKEPSDNFNMVAAMLPVEKKKDKDKDKDKVEAVEAPASTNLIIDSYMDDGLRFAHDGEKIVWIDVARPNELLKTGTTSFVPREPARVYVASFKGYPGINLDSETSFKGFLQRLPSVKLVNSREEADMVLDARVTDFKQDKDQLFGGLIPYEYSCTTTLEYDLQDVATGKYIAQKKVLNGVAKASFRSEIYKAIAAAVGVSAIFGGDIGKYGPWVIGGAELYRLKRQMQKAANRCPGISERQVFDSLLQDINSEVDYRAQVTDVDYGKGLITLGVGSKDGVRVSTPEKPFEFEISIGDVPLLDKSENGRSADYYTAVVRDVKEDSCVCEVRHVQGSVKDNSGEIPSQVDADVVRHLPDPATGVLAARAWTRFAPVTIISDELLAQSDAQESQKRASEPPPKKPVIKLPHL